MNGRPDKGPDAGAGRKVRRRVLIGAIIAAGVALLLLANAHLVYVAVTSQPECVAHSKTAGEVPGSYRAARSSC